jgi:hypothetical protein
MQKGEDLNLDSQDGSAAVVHPARSEGISHSAYKNRILLAGFLILALSFLAGILLSFYQWENGYPFDLSNWGSFNPLARATYGPIVFVLFLFPFTFPVLLVLSLPIYFGMRKKRLWPLSLLGFLSIGLLWLWLILVLWAMD